jgi:aminopeptidase N
MGFPVVTVSEEEKDDNKRILKLTQKRFIADGTEDMAKPLWQVPINISSEANPNDVVHKILLKQTEQTKETITGIPANQWIKVCRLFDCRDVVAHNILISLYGFDSHGR